MLGISQGKNKYCTILLFVGIDRKASYGRLLIYEFDTLNHWICKTAADVYSLEYTSTSYGLPLIYEFVT